MRRAVAACLAATILTTKAQKLFQMFPLEALSEPARHGALARSDRFKSQGFTLTTPLSYSEWDFAIAELNSYNVPKLNEPEFDDAKKRNEPESGEREPNKSKSYISKSYNASNRNKSSSTFQIPASPTSQVLRTRAHCAWERYRKMADQMQRTQFDEDLLPIAVFLRRGALRGNGKITGALSDFPEKVTSIDFSVHDKITGALSDFPEGVTAIDLSGRRGQHSSTSVAARRLKLRSATSQRA